MAALVTILCDLDYGKQNVKEYRSTICIFFYSDSRTSVFFLNVQTYIPDRTVSQPRGLQYEPSPP